MESRAAGFALYEWSNRGNGMGGAMIALADDASALAYNPAGITQLEGTQTMVGVSLIAPSASVDMGGKTYKSKNKLYAAPHAYVTQQMSDKLWFGVGGFSRFGVGTNYDHDWAGRYNVYKGVMKSYTVQPTMAFKATDNWSLALGVDIMRAAFEQKKKRNIAGTDYDIHINAEGWTIGYNLSTRYEFDDQWSLGLVYRAKQKMVGRGSFNMNLANTASGVTMEAYLPGSAAAGLAYKPTEDLSLDFDVVRTFWADYKQIEYYYNNDTSSMTAKNYKDVWRFQLGAEYEFIDNNYLRAGLVYDQSPIREGYEDFMLPTNDRTIYSLGYGYSNGPWTIDLSGMYVHMEGRVIEARGNEIPTTAHIQDSRALITGLSVGYKF
ncbi:outer membrane protein transport protein [Salidesulfovibrio brasiliensis]